MVKLKQLLKYSYNSNKLSNTNITSKAKQKWQACCTAAHYKSQKCLQMSKISVQKNFKCAVSN